MQISIEDLKTIILEELDQEGDVNWKTRSLSVVTLLTNINSQLAVQTDLINRQNELLERIANGSPGGV